MTEETFDSPGHSKGDSNSFLTGVLGFWLEWLNTCFSDEAGEFCLPAGLALLSALVLLVSCLLVLCQKFKSQGEYSGETIMVFYCFLGHLCCTVGAILSRQLHIQVFMSVFAATLDALSCVLCCCPVFLCWNSEAQRRFRMVKRRRRQHLLAVGVLMVIAGGFLKSTVAEPPVIHTVGGRKLLNSLLQAPSWSLLMDNIEILGYTLGLLSFLIACTSRFPALCRAIRGQRFALSYIWSRLLCSVSGALYAAAIFLYNTQFGFLLRVLPWLLSAVTSSCLDLLVIVIHWCNREARQRSMKVAADTESLLGGLDVKGECTAVQKQPKKHYMPSAALLKYSPFSGKMKRIQKMTEMGQYMDISVQPTRKEKMEDRALGSVVRLVRVGSLCSSDTSYDSSNDSSDLEWDFGAALSQWNKPTVKSLHGDAFPLQDWPITPKPHHTCTCSQQPTKLPSGTDEQDPDVI